MKNSMKGRGIGVVFLIIILAVYLWMSSQQAGGVAVPTTETPASGPAASARGTTRSENGTPASDPAAVTADVSGAEAGRYDNSAEYVAAYLREHGALPEYFMTKDEAKSLGWIPSEGNLWEVLPGRAIGGDRFGNREKRLPEGVYYECDVNYSGGPRGPERIVFSESGDIYYTPDHYKTFQKLE